MTTMTRTLIVSTLALAATGISAQVSAQEMGRVLSSTPVVQQVAVPRQVCNTVPVAVGTQKSGVGAVLGAIAGGAVGNSVGGGSGRAAATVLGVLGGAMLGDNIEGGGVQQVQNMQQCGTQTVYENRSVAYNVVYEYAGRQYTVQMPNDPGPTIPLQITPVGSAQPQPAPQAVQQPYGVAPYPVPAYSTYPAYPVAYPGYYARPYAPVGVSLNLGYSSHRHWR